MNPENKTQVEKLTERKNFLEAAIVSALMGIDAHSCVHFDNLETDVMWCRVVVGYFSELEQVRLAIAAASLDVDSNSIVR